MTDRLWPGQERVLRASVGGSIEMSAGNVNPAALHLAFGIDPERDATAEPVVSVQVSGRLLRRPVAPRKRRGLTGKRYRIARRHYGREMRAYRRGEGERVDVHYYVPRARVGRPTIRGTRALFTVLGETDLSAGR